MTYEPATWNIKVFASPNSADEAGDLVHEAMSALMAALTRADVRDAAITMDGAPGPRTRARIAAERDKKDRGA